MPCAAGTAQSGLPGSRGHVHTGRRAQALRLLGAGAAAARHRRGFPRGRRRNRGCRGGADRDLEANPLGKEIEDRWDNTPRFLVVGRKLFSASGADRTTLLVSAADTDDAGALFRLLEPFAQHRVNMTRIESRPSRKRKWDYVFFMDVEGHVSDAPVAKALAALEKRASLFKVLGSYPRAVL